MICKCDALTLRRKRFSDFELVDPQAKIDGDQIYIAGYYETSEGEKKNIKMSSSVLFHERVGNSIPALTPTTKHDAVTITDDFYDETVIKLITINYMQEVDFLQINKISPSLYTEIEGKKYLCIKQSDKTPIGYTYRIYLPNFPFDYGVLLFPYSSKDCAHNTPIEIFYNEKEDDDDTTEANDFYFTLLHIADPKSFDDEEPLLKTKIIRVLNIESE